MVKSFTYVNKNMTNKDIRDKLAIAIAKYNEAHPKKFYQYMIDETVDPSHINNVASGKSTNKELRKKIETFIKKNY